MAKGGCRPPLVRLQNVVAGGGSDDGQRKRGPGEEDRDGGKRARGGGQLRGWTLESIQGEPASGGWRRGGWKAENLRPPLNSYRTSYRTSSRINVCTHAANTLVGKKWTRTRCETAKDSRGIFLNSVPVLERDPSIFRKRGRRNSPSPLLRKYRETILGIAFFDLANVTIISLIVRKIQSFLETRYLSAFLFPSKIERTERSRINVLSELPE